MSNSFTKATPRPWRFGLDVVVSGASEEDFLFVVEAVNSYDHLTHVKKLAKELARSTLAYDEAILSCANNPEKMASFCTAEGEDLDRLYLDWKGKARELLAEINKDKL